MSCADFSDPAVAYPVLDDFMQRGAEDRLLD